MPALSPRTARAALGVIAALFIACTVVTELGGFDRLDLRVAVVATRTGGHTANVVLSLMALPASVPISVAWLALLALAALAAQRGRRRVAVLAAGLALASVLELALKALLHHPGPGRARTILGLGVETFGRSSYPSGHMLRGLALAFCTALLLRGGPWGAFLVAGVYAAVLAWTRVYLNEHWTSDVIGGALVGVGIIVAVAAVPRARRR